MTTHTSAPPDIPALIAIVEKHGVRYIITGSVASYLYGVDVGQPGDMDITPALDQENLSHLADALRDIEAVIDGQVGDWETNSDGERKWIEKETTEEERKSLQAAWLPDPTNLASLDHSFFTRYGNLDVVPEVSGTYDSLIGRATRLDVYGYQVWVEHIDDILAAITVPRRKKDIPRVKQLRAIQRKRGNAG